MHIGGFERQLLLRHCRRAQISGEAGDGSAGAKTGTKSNECAAIHVSPPASFRFGGTLHAFSSR
jgi:hypothetical protein